MTGDLVAQLKGASFSYYGAPETLHAVDLDVHAGECVVLMGASGSGKTTIVRVLNGLAGGYYRGSVSGDVFLGGLSARDMEAWRRAELVGSVFQDPTAQFFSSQLAGEVAFGCENIGYPAEEVVRRTDAAIGRLGLDRLRTIAVDELSSGQKQRVAIASSLAPAPRLVVMDEPSSNLDEDAAQELGAVLMELKRQGYALVVAEHRISYLMECADRFCYMEAGRMRAVLSRDDVFAMEGSERVAMGVRSPAFVPRPSLKPAPLAAGPAREGERAVSGEAFGARLEAASLEVDGLAVSRGGNLLFSDVCFAVEPGQIMALTGKNGVGKTSLAQVAVGLGRPDEGCVRVGGRKLSRRELRRRVWYSPNDVSMEFFSSRVDEEVLLFSDQDDAARRYADHVLGRLGLAELGDRHPSSLSGGQKQRLSIACGLASRRSVLILDEPTSGLDALSMRRLADALRCAAEEGAAVVVITHDGKPSSRIKDLVDVAIYATTVDIDGGELCRRVRSEAGARGIVLPDRFSVPDEWKQLYEGAFKKLVSRTGLSSELSDIAAAEALAASLFDPVLARKAGDLHWDHESLSWEGLVLEHGEDGRRTSELLRLLHDC